MIAATKEMVVIMQENCEVVCVYGSCLNVTNVDIFLQADVRSAAMFPSPNPVSVPNSLKLTLTKNKDSVQPLELSQKKLLCFENNLCGFGGTLGCPLY